MTNSEEKKLLEFVKKIAPKNAKINLDTQLFEKKVLDSMNILDLLGYVEKKLKRKLKNNEIVMPNFRSVKTILKVFFEPKKNGK